MMILKVDHKGQAMFSIDSQEWRKIDEISKTDISTMLDLCIDNDVILEVYDVDKILQPAQRIIYQSVYEKFKDFIEDKPSFLTHVNGLYKDALEKYQTPTES